MEEKIRGVWFKVDIQHAEWVPVLAKVRLVWYITMNSNGNLFTIYMQDTGGCH